MHVPPVHTVQSLPSIKIKMKPIATPRDSHGWCKFHNLYLTAILLLQTLRNAHFPPVVVPAAFGSPLVKLFPHLAEEARRWLLLVEAGLSQRGRRVARVALLVRESREAPGVRASGGLYDVEEISSEPEVIFVESEGEGRSRSTVHMLVGKHKREDAEQRTR